MLTKKYILNVHRVGPAEVAGAGDEGAGGDHRQCRQEKEGQRRQLLHGEGDGGTEENFSSLIGSLFKKSQFCNH